MPSLRDEDGSDDGSEDGCEVCGPCPSLFTIYAIILHFVLLKLVSFEEVCCYVLRNLRNPTPTPADAQWMLGFVDQAESPTALLRHRFPSKVGGRPVRGQRAHSSRCLG